MGNYPPNNYPPVNGLDWMHPVSMTAKAKRELVPDKMPLDPSTMLRWHNPKKYSWQPRKPVPPQCFPPKATGVCPNCITCFTRSAACTIPNPPHAAMMSHRSNTSQR